MIGILNIGLGNVQSVFNAVYENGYDPIFVSKPEQLSELSHFILPGVGNFSAVMQQLHSLKLDSAIQEYAAQGKPLLGICLGMQLLAESGEEGGETQGLGFIPALVSKIDSHELRVPHVGWNQVDFHFNHPVLENIKNERDFYFVHSFQMQCKNSEHLVASTDYGNQITAIVAKGNVVGTQFHPEKSQKNGMQLLENFCEWDGKC